MTVFNWAINAAALLVLLYGVRVALQPEKEGGGSSRASLGCGFLFLTCVLWGLASHNWVGTYADGLRLGLGVFLITPVVTTLSRPSGPRLILGVGGLILGILLAGPIVRDLIVNGSGTQVESIETPQPEEPLSAEELYELETQGGAPSSGD